VGRSRGRKIDILPFPFETIAGVKQGHVQGKAHRYDLGTVIRYLLNGFGQEMAAIWEGKFPLDSPFRKEYFLVIRFRLFPINPAS